MSKEQFKMNNGTGASRTKRERSEAHLLVRDAAYGMSGAKLFIVDDQEYVLNLLKVKMGKAGYQVEIFKSGKDLLNALADAEKPPDLVITDIQMPDISGVEMVKHIRERDKNLPVVAITGYLTNNLYKDLFEQGFCEVIPKPFQMEIFIQKIKTILENAQIPTYKKLNDALVLTIANMGDVRDTLTQNHNLRLGEMCFAVATGMGLGDSFAGNIRLAARMHDIGKLSITDAILRKPGKLTEEEWEHIKTHTTSGAAILEPLTEILSMDYLKMASEIALSHHEKLDGTGYPVGLKGDDIPLHVRIATVADIYDACTMKRSYHDSKAHDFGMQVIQEEMEAGKLDPEVVAAFIECSEEIQKIKKTFSEYPL